MGSMAFPGMESNNAPLPLPGGYGNPTGVNTGGFKLQQSKGDGTTPFGPAAFPNFPAFGPIATPGANTGVRSPAAKANVVGGFNTSASPTGGVTPAIPGANAPVFGGTDIQGLSSGIYSQLNGKPGNPGDQMYKELTNAYGKGTGAALFNLLIGGTFNPQTAAAFLNAMQPGVQRGEADILGAFGDAGSRFSSSASLGLGDYLSQVNLNEQQTLAGLYNQGQQNELSLLQNILPTLHDEQANKGGGIFADILGGLEIAGGIAAAPFTGGTSLGLVGAGVGTLTGANSGGGGKSGGSSQGGIGALLQQLYKQQSGGVNMSGVSMGPTPASQLPMEIPQILGISGGTALGGADPFGGGGDNTLAELMGLL